MLVDLHAHYPMHLLPRERRETQGQLKRWRRALVRAQIVRLLSHFANYEGPGDEPGVTLELMHRGDVGVIFSALLCPFDEVDLSKRYGAAPGPGYFEDLLDQLDDVEADIASHRRAGASVTVAHTPRELEQALSSKAKVLLHSVEGGFHLGASDEQIHANVKQLAERGVVCITVAHLFWRRVATNAPALPFMSDGLYRFLFHQSRRVGLAPLGRTVVDAMAANGILIDVTHMSEAAIDDTLDRLDELHGKDRIPVIATHMAYRFGDLAYNLDERVVRRIAKRRGLLGLILCEHYISDGASKPDSFERSFELLCKHIDKICEITQSQDHVAFGSDLDGYIKPALPGLDHMGHMHRLQKALEARYGTQAAGKFTSANALRVIEATWQSAPGGPSPSPGPGSGPGTVA